MNKRTPCPTCPWRVGVDAWAIGRTDDTPVPPLHYDQMVEMAGVQPLDLFSTKLMGCHHHHRDEDNLSPHDRVCVGFALQAGPDNVQYRLSVVQGRIDPDDFSCDEPLHCDFGEMLAANPYEAYLKAKELTNE